MVLHLKKTCAIIYDMWYVVSFSCHWRSIPWSPVFYILLRLTTNRPRRFVEVQYGHLVNRAGTCITYYTWKGSTGQLNTGNCRGSPSGRHHIPYFKVLNRLLLVMCSMIICILPKCVPSFTSNVSLSSPSMYQWTRFQSCFSSFDFLSGYERDQQPLTKCKIEFMETTIDAIYEYISIKYVDAT